MHCLTLNTFSFFTGFDSLSTKGGGPRSLSFPLRRNRFTVFASREEPELDRWDQMELKFGRLIGEDPKLTLAKIMARKANPDVSYLEIEKSFLKNNGKLPEVKELPFDDSRGRQSSTSVDGLNLARPVPNKSMKFKNEDKISASEIRKPSQIARKAALDPKGSVPNVILRKPTIYAEDDVEEKPSRLRIKSNLSFKISSDTMKDKFTDMTLLRKPEPNRTNTNVDKEGETSGNEDSGLGRVSELPASKGELGYRVNDIILMEKPKSVVDETQVENSNKQFANTEAAIIAGDSKGSYVLDDIAAAKSKNFEETDDGLFPIDSVDADGSALGEPPCKPSNGRLNAGTTSLSVLPEKAMLQQKPERLDQSFYEPSNFSGEEKGFMRYESYSEAVKFPILPTAPNMGEHGDTDWRRAEDLSKSGDRTEVELISSSTQGFVVSFGSLIGFLPYRNLAAKWKFLAFESWLRRKGLEPSKYKQNLGFIGSYDGGNRNFSLNAETDPEIDVKIGGELSADMKLEDLLKIYDQEKSKFLSSFIGQKIKVNVVVANRKSRKLLFSVRQKEKEESVERKRSVMAKLQIGDVVKCRIVKITYFGIFVEVEGAPALIHQTEVSWDATMDPSSFFKVGQVIEAKVHLLDFTLERIFLSLKEITPDPLIEALDSVVGDRNTLDGRLEAAETDTEWADVESLIKELQGTEGIQSVSKGRFFFSPGLAPTFQVYMASMFENQYKLLARSGNRVQEVMVQTSLDKEEMKSAILRCTNKVE